MDRSQRLWYKNNCKYLFEDCLYNILHFKANRKKTQEFTALILELATKVGAAVKKGKKIENDRGKKEVSGVL